MCISIFLAISLIVLCVKRYEIIQGEAVMAGYEVDTLFRKTEALGVDVGASKESLFQISYRTTIGLDERTHIIAEPSIPLFPRILRERSNLIKAPCVPCFRHQLGPREHGIGIVFPAWQIEGTRTVPHLEEVLAALHDQDEWRKLSFFVNGNIRLDGKSPLEVLRAGEYEDVLKAARSLGEHGAA